MNVDGGGGQPVEIAFPRENFLAKVGLEKSRVAKWFNVSRVCEAWHKLGIITNGGEGLQQRKIGLVTQEFRYLPTESPRRLMVEIDGSGWRSNIVLRELDENDEILKQYTIKQLDDGYDIAITDGDRDDGLEEYMKVKDLSGKELRRVTALTGFVAKEVAVCDQDPQKNGERFTEYKRIGEKFREEKRIQENIRLREAYLRQARELSERVKELSKAKLSVFGFNEPIAALKAIQDEGGRSSACKNFIKLAKREFGVASGLVKVGYARDSGRFIDPRTNDDAALSHNVWDVQDLGQSFGIAVSEDKLLLATMGRGPSSGWKKGQHSISERGESFQLVIYQVNTKTGEIFSYESGDSWDLVEGVPNFYYLSSLAGSENFSVSCHDTEWPLWTDEKTYPGAK